MRDEEYREQDLPAYGEAAQPAILARTGTEVRKVAIGTGLAALASVLGWLAVWRYPVFVGTDAAGRGWAITLPVSCLVLLGLCGGQLLAWRRAQAAWSGRASGPLRSLSRTSFLLHLVSYAAVAGAVAGCLGASGLAGWSATATALAVLALVTAIAAQVLGAAQYVRASGPPGTVPAHMHRLTERDDHRTGHHG